MYYGYWWGGGSYAAGDVADYLETFATLADARDEFATRFHSGRFNTFRWADGTVTRDDTPAVDESATLWLWRVVDPRTGDVPADRVLSIGPRGGVRIERA